MSEKKVKKITQKAAREESNSVKSSEKTGKTHKSISFKNVKKEFRDGTLALNDVTLDIDHGEFVFLIGSSGAGKTTLMNLIVKEEVPSSGDVIVLGSNVSEMKRKHVYDLRRNVGYIFQDFKLLDTKTVYENVALSLEVAGINDDKISKVVPNLLELVGLSDKANRFPGNLSGGEKQRLAIARALAHEPKILLADEPTGNLDDTSAWVIVDLIKRINDWGTTIIFGTHNLEIVKSMNKRVIKLEKGKLVSS